MCLSLCNYVAKLATYLLIWVSYNVGLLFVSLVVEMLSTNKAIGHSRANPPHEPAIIISNVLLFCAREMPLHTYVAESEDGNPPAQAMVDGG